MKVGSRIYEHTDGRWEARYRKGRKADGSIIYGSVYGRTYEEAERRRAEILRTLAIKAENGESEDAVQIFEENRNIRSYYAVTPKNKTVYPDPLSEEEVQELIPYIRMCPVGLGLAICFALYMGVSGDEIAALRFSDIRQENRRADCFPGDDGRKAYARNDRPLRKKSRSDSKSGFGAGGLGQCGAFRRRPISSHRKGRADQKPENGQNFMVPGVFRSRI